MAGVWVGFIKDESPRSQSELGSVKAGVVKSKYLVWNEPEPALTADGEIYIPDEEEDANYETKSSD